MKALAIALLIFVSGVELALWAFMWVLVCDAFIDGSLATGFVATALTLGVGAAGALSMREMWRRR